MVSITETGVFVSPINHFRVAITTGEHPLFPPYRPTKPTQNPKI